MIHLNSETHEKDQILELLTSAINNDELELECIFNKFNTYKQQDSNINNRNYYNVSYTNFVAALSRFKTHPEYDSKINTRLTITFPYKSKLNDTRISIKGIGAINSYCNNESLNTIINMVDFETKTRPKINTTTVIVPNYNIKFNIKQEVNFNNDENRIKNIIYEWPNELKNYRYKKTFSFIKKTGDFQIDISIVKASTNIDRFLSVEEVIKYNLLRYVVKPVEIKSFSIWWKSIEHKPQEKVMVRNGDNYYKNIKDSNVFANTPSYEIEVEYIHNKTTSKPKFKNIDTQNAYVQQEFTAFFRIIGSVLQCIQGSSFIISNIEKNSIIKQFTKVVVNSVTESMFEHYNAIIQKGGTITDDNIEEQFTKEDNNDQTNLDGGGNNTILEIRKRIVKRFERNGIFFGPLIIDLSHNNAEPLNFNKSNKTIMSDIETNTNIHINYVVTDKTDGDRYLLFINGEGLVYGIDRESNIKQFGIVIQGLANTILDGEYVSRTEDNKVINNYYIFDAYIFKGDAILHLPFLYNKLQGRHNLILEVIKYFNTGNVIQLNPKIPFMLYKKDYLPGDSNRSYQNLYEDETPLISRNCENLLNKMNVKYGGFLEVGHLFTYKTDGLVFLPNNLGVFQQYVGDNLQTIGGHPFVDRRWNNNYKWKPGDYLTIDFKIMFVKEFAGDKLAYRYMNDKKYLLVKLKCAVYQSNNKYSKDNNALNFYLLNSGIKIQNIPENYDFFALNPFIGTYDNEGNLENYMSDALVIVDNNGNVLCENGDIINDGQIVECSYNKTEHNEQHRWKLHRVRADKQYPNNYLTAITTWGLINNPISKEYISSIQQSNNKFNTLENVTYYSNNENTTFLTKPLNKFINNFIKRQLISRALKGYVKPSVLDLATGKFGDLLNYINADVYTFIGIEIGYDGLNNPNDGACTRITEMSTINPAISKLAERTILIVGNATKNIASGECVRDNINKYYLDVIYGNSKGNTPKLRKLEGVALDQFDCVSCMYGIHYMMDTENDLDNFLRNVSENLREQCYFIGTCLDGMAILKEMGNNNEINGIIDNKTIYNIKKMSNEDNAYKDITVGNKILVYYEKFAGQFPENLVNMSYLQKRAKEYNLKLIEYRTYLEEPGNMLAQYYNIDDKAAKFITNTEALMTWAKFNAYFIFQKIRNE